MIRDLLMMLTALVCMLLQAPLLKLIGLQVFSIDIALCATIYMASANAGALGLVLAAILGLAADFLVPGGLVGIEMEIQVILFLLARSVLARLQLNRTVTVMLVVAVSSIASLLMFLLLSVIFDRAYEYSSSVVLAGVLQAIATAVFAPLVFRLFSLVDGRARRKRDSRGLIF